MSKEYSYMYYVEKIKDSIDYPKGTRMWIEQPCPGWRILKKVKVSNIVK